MRNCNQGNSVADQNQNLFGQKLACPQMGTLGNDQWTKPILACHRMQKRRMGDAATFLFPQIGEQWSEMLLTPRSSASARRLSIKIVEVTGVEKLSRISLRSARNFTRKASAPSGWSLEGGNKAGRWAKNSVVADRCDRSVAASELALRQDAPAALARGSVPEKGGSN